MNPDPPLPAQGSPAAKGGKPKGQSPVKKKANPTREKARAMFDSSAAPLSVEKFFTGFTEVKRDNVEMIFDYDSVIRISEPYITKARDHAVYRLNQSDKNEDLQAITFALIGLTAARKMLHSVPNSEKYDLGRFSYIKDTEWYAPKAVIAAVDNIGKFEKDDFVARIKYNSQDIFRLLMMSCKVASRHKDFKDRYESPVHDVAWKDLEPNKLVITSEASVRWLRDMAAKFLDKAYETTWKVKVKPDTGDAYNLEVSYPKLKMSPDMDKQLENVIAWLNKLSPNMPGIDYMIAAGMCTCWKLLYFKRIGHMFKVIEKGLPAWFDFRPFDIITTLGLKHCDVATDDYDGIGYIAFIEALHEKIGNMRQVFNSFLELAKQPNNEFGSAAQLIVYNKEKDFSEKPIFGIEDAVYQAIKPDVQALSVVKVANKGDAVAGLIFGFSRKVQVVDNYLSKTNGNPNAARSSYLRADFRAD